jgi:uncharacterized protein
MKKDIKDLADGAFCKEWDGLILRALFNAGVSWVENCILHLNSIDIYPVPVGSAGIRIYLTLKYACAEINSTDEESAALVAKTFATSTLKRASGHQTIPFTQWFRGFARGLNNKSIINGYDLANALMEAAETAYRAEIRPRQGEMWTVAKDVASEALKVSKKSDDLCHILHKSTLKAEQSVRKTTKLIPVLKHTGLVHSGGLALFLFLDGMCSLLDPDLIVPYEKVIRTY